jgi:ABC-2 type transport system ATP-binding protein
MANLVLQTHELGKVYQRRRSRIEALRGLNLKLYPGEVFGFLGPNGAGKSTTIKILTGQIRATSGCAALMGQPVNEVCSRQSLGYLPENPIFFDYLTGREYLLFVGRCFNWDKKKCIARAGEVLERLELTHAADRAMRTYSKGMLQRLGIAQTLMHDPELFIFDEPMSGLDPMGRALVKGIIKDLRRKGKTVFFSTHITADVEVVCDRLGVIAGGRLRALDRVENILNLGVEGYTVQITGADGHVSELSVPLDQLQQHLQKLWADGARVERIEPCRKNLESLFLDIVAQAESCE